LLFWYGLERQEVDGQGKLALGIETYQYSLQNLDFIIPITLSGLSSSDSLSTFSASLLGFLSLDCSLVLAEGCLDTSEDDLLRCDG